MSVFALVVVGVIGAVTHIRHKQLSADAKFLRLRMRDTEAALVSLRSEFLDEEPTTRGEQWLQ